MRLRSSRWGSSGIVAVILVASTACASSGAPAPGVDTTPARDVAAAPKASSAAPVTPTAAKVKTRTSGCNTDANYEICFSSPAAKGGSDPAVVRRFVEIFNAAGAGDSLRIAMFRWDIPVTTKALVAAQKRGAHVEIVADADMTTKPAGRAVMAQIESGDPAPGNVVVCKGSCLPWRGRGPAPPSQDVNHLKYLLADIGGRRSVITSSSNFEGRQYSQVNSLARVYDDAFYDFGLQYFQRLRAQSWTVGGVTWKDAQKRYQGPPPAMVYPRRSDLVLNTLKQVHCAKGMKTVDILVAVIQRYDIRAQIGRLWNEGCKMRIVTTRDLIENWLQSPFRLPNGQRVDINDNVVRTIVAHDKVYAIHAKVGGKERYLVLTGTSNTTCGGLLYNDEMMLRLDGQWAFKTYVAHVTDAFRHAHQSRESVVPVQARCR
ncbi:phospholipase D-like domain-containing protein [uncultured Nocardioides sp.]|uniref:phospholipase D-like domain-containing protein n=1 Tax=uncultured Nocardioides sp. TaxID=198441 RepID=UPI0026087C74|nr:phospholipase D-like domain-containing protein [uncultured Nocardioides sp.]HRD59999.1 phospholipase D-like domain-containing protein [Nocardioides sp.]